MSVIVIYAIVLSIFQIDFVSADYNCLCNYNVEIPIFSKDSSASQVIGYMYEFDCKATFAKVAKDSKFQTVQFENQVGYIENGNGLLIQICQGSVPIDDRVKTTTSTIASTTKTTTTPQLLQTSSTSLPLVTERLTSSVPTTQIVTTSPQNSTSSPQSTGAIVIISNGNITVLTNGTQDNNSTSKPSQLPSTFSSSSTSLSTTSSSQIPVSTTSPITSQATRSASTTVPISTIRISSIQSSTAQSTTTKSLTSTTSTIPPTTTSATTTTHSTPAATTSTTTISSSTTRVTSTTHSTPAATTSTTTIPFSSTRVTSTSPSTTASTTPTPTPSTTTQRPMTTAPKPSCPNGWIMHMTSCYMFHTNDRRHWSDANNDCVSKTSHLAIVETTDEFNFLKQQLDQRIDTHDNDHSDTSAWVAGRDNNNEGTWEWYDGLTNTYKPFSYTHWGNDEPDSGDGEHEEDCMTMVGNEGFRWADYSCDENMFYVCEQSALPQMTVQTKTPSPPKQTNAATCPRGWIMHHGSCYLFHTDSREKWRHANSFCSQHQAHLVIIETPEEDRFIKQESSKRIHEDDDDSDSGVWVGGSDDDDEGHWEWIDDFSHTHRSMKGTYSNWYPGEPDSGDGDHGEDCMCLIGVKGFQWQDYHCGEHMFFICEKSTTFAAPLVG